MFNSKPYNFISMKIHHKGKFTLFYLLVLFLVFNNSEVVADNEVVSEKERTVSDQIKKLEEIVKNLTDLVSRLETHVSFSNEKEKINEKIVKQPKEIIENEAKYTDSGSEDGTSVVTKYDPSWSENFHFVSAVKLNSDAASVNILPFRNNEGLSKYFAVGDNKGKVYVFLRNGDVVVEFNTVSDSPVTTMLSYLSVYKNDTVLVTGHKNGLVLVHRVWETFSGDELISVHMDSSEKHVGFEMVENGSSINVLEVHHVGRMRYILSTDMGGMIKVYKENGDLHGSVVPSSKPIAFLKQRLLFLTETGAGSLDLRTMKIKESECEGLDDSYVESYVFDTTERSKAYGFASDGDIVQVLLLGDVTNFKCRVRSKKKVGIDKPFSMQSIKGYLIIVNHEKIFVFNASSQHYVRVVSLRLSFSASLDDIRSSFIKDNYLKGPVIPLLTSNKEKLVIIGLGGGYVGMYRSNLPNFKGEHKNMFWSSPILIFVLFLFGAWQFFAKKKEALTSWGPDDPLNTTTSIVNGAQLESYSRNNEVMELRGGNLRGPSRRYVSPSRYSAPSPNPRPPTVDPSFRSSSELKFRGSNIESVGFPKRREIIFVNNQVVDDST